MRVLPASSFAKRGGIGILFLASLPFGIAVAASLRPQPPPPSFQTPRRTVETFDSLLEAGTPEAVAAARALTAGSVRRLFPLLVEAQGRLAPFLDTARSFDSVLEEAQAGGWAAIKFRSRVVFRKRFLGMDSMESVQAAHLHRDSAGWKIAELEELPDAAARLIVRSGPLPTPDSPQAPGALAAAAEAGFLPISRLAPAGEDMRRVTRLRLRVSLRGGEALSPPSGPGQRLTGKGPASDPWIGIETSVPAVIDSLSPAPWDDTLAPYRASTAELDLTDKMLRTRAAKLKQGSPHDLETTRRIWRHVSASFRYKLGATLFGTSREALRDMRGDCSEAAVLTAALLRAAGIPSRVVLGYATLGSGVWIGHAWAEAYLGGEWIGVDAALREFPAGASRLALLTLSGEKEMKPEATNLMLRTLASLDIQILEARSGGKPLPLRAHPGAASESRRFWDDVLKGMGE